MRVTQELCDMLEEFHPLWINIHINHPKEVTPELARACDKLARAGRWSRELFEEVADWGANVVRLPVHPVAWRARGRDGYFRLLDPAVVWASELGLYLMIDWHSIGNLQSGLFQHPLYDTTRPETLDQLSHVSGVGARKLEAYGPAFLKVISDHLAEA